MGALRVLVRGVLLAALVLTVGSAEAFEPAPKASAKALGVTRGKPFSIGLAFVNGKMLDPPYVVERWGTCIRINGTPVTGQVVDWNEFLKTQPGVKVVKDESAEQPAEETPAAPAETESVATAVVTPAEAVDSLDDLFGDEPKPRKKKAETPAPASRPSVVQVRKPAAPAKPRATVSYVLEEPFAANDASKALLAKVNAARTKIDRILRSGGFVFFGDRYSSVTGDARTLAGLMDALPELLQKAKSMDEFRTGVNAAKLFYINGPLCQELYDNRIDYRRLRERRERIRRSAKWDQVLQGAGESLY